MSELPLRAQGACSNAELLAMPASPITLIDAPGAGILIRPLRITLFIHCGNGSTGIQIAGGGQLALGLGGLDTVVIGDAASSVATAPDSTIAGWAEPLLSAGLFSAMATNSYNMVDCLVASMASSNGAISIGVPNGLNEPLQLVVSAGTITNRTGSNVTLNWDISYDLIEMPDPTLG
jgi:hypothetical protein